MFVICMKVIVDQQKTTDAWNFDLGPFQVEQKKTSQMNVASWFYPG